MSRVTFLTPTHCREVTVPALPDDSATLLALGTRHDIPLLADCRAGRCGTCAVKVAPVHRDGPRYVRLGMHEKEVLYLAGKLSPQQYQAEELPDIPPLWRLACQYQVGNEDLWVAARAS